MEAELKRLGRRALSDNSSDKAIRVDTQTLLYPYNDDIIHAPSVSGRGVGHPREPFYSARPRRVSRGVNERASAETILGLFKAEGIRHDPAEAWR